MLPRRGRFYIPPPSLPAGREGGVDTHYHEPRLRKTLFAESALRCFRRRVVDTCVDRPVHVRRPVRISLLIGHTHRRAPPHRRVRRCGGRCRTCILIRIDGLAHHGSLAPSHLMISLRIGACADAVADVVRGAEADVVRACVRICIGICNSTILRIVLGLGPVRNAPNGPDGALAPSHVIPATATYLRGAPNSSLGF